MTYWDTAIETVKKGWGKGHLWGRSKNTGEEFHCMLGAIGVARWGQQFDGWVGDWQHDLRAMMQEDPVTSAMIAKVRTVIHEQYPQYRPDHGLGAIYHFNDFFDRTQEEILAILEKAAADGDPGA